MKDSHDMWRMCQWRITFPKRSSFGPRRVSLTTASNLGKKKTAVAPFHLRWRILSQNVGSAQPSKVAIVIPILQLSTPSRMEGKARAGPICGTILMETSGGRLWLAWMAASNVALQLRDPPKGLFEPCVAAERFTFTWYKLELYMIPDSAVAVDHQ